VTKLLDAAVKAARRLPPDAQDEIAPLVLRFSLGDESAPVALTEAESAAIEVSKAAAAVGAFASEEEVREVWIRHGL
jgi:hypothetical protein